MENFILIIQILSAVVGIIALIKFFYLCSNVERIANESTDIQQFDSKFKLLIASGLNDEASKLLVTYIQNDDLYYDAVLSKNHSSSSSARAHLHEQYDKYYEILGKTLDFDKVDKLYELSQKANLHG